MKLLVIPNYLADAINEKIDKALAGRPCEDEERQYIFSTIVEYVDEHGQLPNFDLRENSAHFAVR